MHLCIGIYVYLHNIYLKVDRYLLLNLDDVLVDIGFPILDYRYGKTNFKIFYNYVIGPNFAEDIIPVALLVSNQCI